MWITKPKFCQIVQPDDVIHANMDPLSLLAMGGPFLLFTVGLIISVMGFCTEHCWLKLKKTLANIGETEHYRKTEKKRMKDVDDTIVSLNYI